MDRGMLACFRLKLDMGHTVPPAPQESARTYLSLLTSKFTFEVDNWHSFVNTN